MRADPGDERVHTNPSIHIIRAALESIGYQIRDVLEAMKTNAGVQIRTIHADGGATRNRFVMQFLADITGLTIAVARMPDCSSLGAAMAGMLGTGACSSFAELARRLPREQLEYRPVMSSERLRMSLYARLATRAAGRRWRSEDVRLRSNGIGTRRCEVNAKADAKKRYGIHPLAKPWKRQSTPPGFLGDATRAAVSGTFVTAFCSLFWIAAENSDGLLNSLPSCDPPSLNKLNPNRLPHFIRCRYQFDDVKQPPA